MSEAEVITETRSERKRRETRERLVKAAEELMLHGRIDDIQIKHITEAADVGHGTFYLHFKSKYEILVPIVQARAAAWDKDIQTHVSGMQDPAEVMVYSGRQMSRLIVQDPIWRWFLQNSGVPVQEMRAAIGTFMARDFGQALNSGRFAVPDVANTGNFLFGAYVSSLLECLELDDPTSLIDQMMELTLRVLGIDDNEAQAMAHQPLQALT